MTTDTNGISGERLVLPAVLAILFILVSAVVVWASQLRPPATAVASEAAPAAAAAAQTSAEAPADTAGASADLNVVIAAINKGGCTACHTIPNIPNAIGQVGPDLSQIGSVAETRREGYSAEEYIRESIREPNTFIAPDCPIGPCIAGTMPQVQLTDAEFEAIVGYLVTLGR